MTLPSSVFELLTVDFLTVAEVASEFYYALMFMDHFSKFAIMVPTLDQTAVTTNFLDTFCECMVAQNKCFHIRT